MKINAQYISKIICVLFLILTSHVNSLSFGIQKKNMKKSHKESVRSTESDPQKADIPNQPIQFQYWVKYLHYRESDAKKPKAFFKNTQFDLQNRKPSTEGQSQDAVNKILI